MAWYIAGMVATSVAPGFALACGLLVPRPWGTPHARLVLLLACASIMELYGAVVALCGGNNTLVYNVYIVVELVLLLGIIGRTGPPHPVRSWSLGALGLGAMLADLAYTRDPHFLLTHGIVAIGCLLTVELVLRLWWLSEHSMEPLHRVPVFWLMIGLMFNFAAAIPLFAFLSYISRTHGDLAYPLYRIVLLLSLVRYALIGKACLMERSARISRQRS